MIGLGLKRLAKKYAMTVSDGIAYGSLYGYATTMSEGAGYKRIDIVTKFTELGQQELFLQKINAEEVSKTYRVQTMTMTTKSICVIFHDTVGTMDRIANFVEWFYPLLAQSGATPVNICIECGQPISDGGWYKANGLAFCLHDACAQQLDRHLEEKAQQRKEADAGSYVTGTIGALLGGVLGAVVWAVVLSMGYIASVVGMLIGWLAEKGYTLLKGKKGKGKIAVLIVVIIFGVLLGTLLPDIVDLAQMISRGEAPGYGYFDIPLLLLEVMEFSSEYTEAVLTNAGMGLLFAALGVFVMLRRTKQEVSDPTIKKLS